MPGLGVSRACRAAILFMALASLQVPVVASADAPAMAGRVRDSIGNLLEGVELLVAAPASDRAVLAVATSDLLGRFSVARLAPGRYRIAAVKAGYLTAIGQIDTRLERWVELVLHPMPEADEMTQAPLPRDSSWALRLPRRNIFRETEQRAEGSPGGEGDGAAGRQESIRIQVDHQVAYHASPGEDDARAGQLQGNTTRWLLASPLGERGRLRLLGSHRSLDNRLDESRGPRNLSAEAFRLDLSYDATPEDQIAIEAFFRHEGLDWNDAARGRPGLHRAQRSWGYRSGWSRQLAAASVVALDVEIQDRAYRLPDDKSEFGNRTIGAGGSYRSVAGSAHELEVDLRGRVVESPMDPVHRTNLSTFSTADGWSVQVEAQDAWALSGPLTLVYGLGYRHSARATDAALIVPRVGGAVTFDRFAMRMMLAYNVALRDEPADIAAGRPWSPPGQEIGYELDVELPLGSGLSLGGSLANEPVQFDATGVESFGDAATSVPVYRTDGNASMQRFSVALMQETGESTRTTLEFSRGEASGMLTAPGTAQAQLLLLSRRQLEFSSGQLGLRILPSGTDLQLEYRRVREQPVVDKLGGGGARQETLELRLTQDLLRLQTMGDWRLLMGLRLASLKGAADEGDGDASYERFSYGDALGHGVSAGLSVTF